MRTATVIVLLAAAVAAAADRRLPSRRPVAATTTATATAPAKPQVFRDFSKVLNAIPKEYDLKAVPPSVVNKTRDWLLAQVKAGDRIELTGKWAGYERTRWVGDVKSESCLFKIAERRMAGQIVVVYATMKQPDRIPALESLAINTDIRITAKATGQNHIHRGHLNNLPYHVLKITIDPATFSAVR